METDRSSCFYCVVVAVVAIATFVDCAIAVVAVVAVTPMMKTTTVSTNVIQTVASVTIDYYHNCSQSYREGHNQHCGHSLQLFIQ